MRNANLLFAALAALAPAVLSAQIPRDNPLSDASHAIGRTGLGTDASDDRAATTFRPRPGRAYVHEFAAHLGKDAARRAELEKGINQTMDVYESRIKDAGMANDVATALAFAVDELYAVRRGESINGETFRALIPRLRAVLAKVDATDVQKQQYYEYALSCAGAVLTLSSGESADDKQRARDLSDILLQALVGAKPDAIVFDGPNIEIPAETEASPEPAPVRQATSAPAAVGGAVLGEWRWTSTGSITNWNSQTGAYMGSGRGMTKRYVFRPDGTFSQDALIQVNDGGHASSVWITAEGRYELHGDTIRFMATRGHLRGVDSMISAGNYDKPMPDSTVRTAVSGTYKYSVRRIDGGKTAFILHLGAQPKDDMVYVDCRPSAKR